MMKRVWPQTPRPTRPCSTSSPSDRPHGGRVRGRRAQGDAAVPAPGARALGRRPVLPGDVHEPFQQRGLDDDAADAAQTQQEPSALLDPPHDLPAIALLERPHQTGQAGLGIAQEDGVGAVVPARAGPDVRHQARAAWLESQT